MSKYNYHAGWYSSVEHSLDEIIDLVSDVNQSVQEIRKEIDLEKMYENEEDRQKFLDAINNIEYDIKDIKRDISFIDFDYELEEKYNEGYDNGWDEARLEFEFECENELIFDWNLNRIESDILIKVINEVIRTNSIDKIETKLKELL